MAHHTLHESRARRRRLPRREEAHVGQVYVCAVGRYGNRRKIGSVARFGAIDQAQPGLSAIIRVLHEGLLVVQSVARIRPRQHDSIRGIRSEWCAVGDVGTGKAVGARPGNPVEREIPLNRIELADFSDIGHRPRDLKVMPAIERASQILHRLVVQTAVPEDVDDAMTVRANGAALPAAGAPLPAAGVGRLTQLAARPRVAANRTGSGAPPCPALRKATLQT